MSILVIGDLLLDDYRFVDVNRVSPEAPCLIGLDRGVEDLRLGGAGNIAHNIRKLTPHLKVVGICSEKYKKLLEKHEIENLCYQDNEPIKMRFIDAKTRIQLFRYDIEPGYSMETKSFFEEFMSDFDFSSYKVCVLGDYLKGVIREDFLLGGCPINIVSTKRNYPHSIIPTKHTAINILIVNDAEYKNFQALRGYDYVVRTEGERGISLFGYKNYEELVAHIDGKKVEVFDVTGAGDTVTAVIAWFLNDNVFSESNLIRACELANLAASQVIKKHGTSVVSFDDLFSEIM